MNSDPYPPNGVRPTRRMSERRPIRRLAAVLTAVATLAPGVLLPVVDAGASTGRPAIEAQHEPGRCHLAHDHLTCLLHASSAPLPENSTHLPVVRPPRPAALESATSSTVASRPSTLLPSPRAPPSLD